LSKSYESQLHSFSGSSSQKSEATVVEFYESYQIDFIPKQIPKEFPNLNGLIFYKCDLPVLKNELISKEFVVLEYLALQDNQIASIEPPAFQNLKNLKWLSLYGNKIRSLPFNLFENNPELIFLSFHQNEINSICPNLFKNQNQLKEVDFRYNRCVDKRFGCKWCPSISQSDLDSGLSTCFQNCLRDPDCATKSELVETTTETEILRDPSQPTPQVTTTPPPTKEEDSSAQNNARAANSNPSTTLQSPQTNLAQELAKNISEKLEAKTATLNQEFQDQQENLASLNQSVASEDTAIKKTVADFRELVRKSEDTCKAETEEAKKMAKEEADAARNFIIVQLERFNRTMAKLEEKSEEMAENFEKSKQNLIDLNGKTMQDFKSEIAGNLTKTLLINHEIKTNVETLSLQLALEMKNHELTRSKCQNLWLKYTNEKLALERENEKLKQEIIDLKKETQDRENALKQEFDKTINEIVSKRLVQFKNELMNEARP
jgi:hypothetical protein